MNLSDSERIKTILESNGLEETKEEESASILGIVACSVRQKSINKVYSRINKWNKNKNERNILTFVSGCILKEDHKNFLKLFDLIVSPKEIPLLNKIIKQYGVNFPIFSSQINNQNNNLLLKNNKLQKYNIISEIKEFQSLGKENNITKKKLEDDNLDIDHFWNVMPKYTNNFLSYVPIQNGCNKLCSYCAVPYTRGEEVSRDSKKIISEVVSLSKKGCKNITLLGQNVNSYGLDKENEINFPALLDLIALELESNNLDSWIYFTSPHPKDFTRELIKVISKHKNLAKQIHLPLQSGSEKMLIKMKRDHSIENYLKIIEDIKELIPNATIFTDIIVGFCGETELFFLETKKIMEQVKYNTAYIACYSPRPGALSYRWKDDIDLKTKKERLAILTDIVKKSSREYNKKMLGKTLKVLLTGIDRKGNIIGYTEGKINVRLEDKNLENKIGTFQNVYIYDFLDFNLEGIIKED